MIKLINNRIAIVPLENPEMIGSIIIPDIAKERLNQGFVKYVGPEAKDCIVGDYVLFSGYTGSMIHVDGEGKLIVMPEDFIIAHISRLPNIQVPGIYFRDKNGEFYEARYENMMGLLAQAFSESPEFRDSFKVKAMEKPALSDYDKMRIGS
jgi:co-chaperonin GroES (HSP10)